MPKPNLNLKEVVQTRLLKDEKGIFGLGYPEVLLIFLVVLLLFGPKKLPELAKAVGDAIRKYRESSSGIVSEPEKKVPTPAPKEDVLIKAAERLGIKTEGKTSDELAQEIAKTVAEGKEKTK